MKVGIVSSEFYPMNAAAAARSGSWATMFLKFGHEVTIFTSSEALPEKYNFERSLFSTPSNRASFAKRFVQEICLGLDLGLRVMLRSKKVELNLITSPPFFMAICCALASRLVGVPYIFDVRDRYPNVLFELGVLAPEKRIGRILLSIEKVIYESSFFVSTVTKGLASDLREIASGRELFLLYNGYDESAFKDELISNTKFPKFTVVYHGRLGRFYNQKVLREVIEIIQEIEPNISFLMIGDLSAFEQQKSWRNVEFMQELPLSELAQVLVRCHVGICLLKETDAMLKALPAKTFDFIGAGLPMIVSPGGELLETVEKERIGVGINKNDANEIAHAIIGLYENTTSLGVFRRNVLKVRYRYGRSKQSKRLIKRLTSCTIC